MSRSGGSIVVGVDGSGSSRQALLWAAEQAEAEHRPLTLLHALPPAMPPWLYPNGNDPPDPRELSLRTKGQAALDRARLEVRLLAPEVLVHDLLRLEDPRDALIEASETASMVVLGSRGRGHMKSLLLGSTAVAVVRHARCPVIVHRPSNPSHVRNGIAVGAAATEDSLPILEFAFRQASVRRQPLTVLNSVWFFPQPSVVDEIRTDPVAARAKQELAVAESLAESLAGFAEMYPDVPVHTEVEQGMPEHLLLRLADEMALLIVGIHPASRAQQFMFGAVSVWLVEHAACPVAVVPLSSNATAAVRQHRPHHGRTRSWPNPTLDHESFGH